MQVRREMLTAMSLTPPRTPLWGRRENTKLPAHRPPEDKAVSAFDYAYTRKLKHPTFSTLDDETCPFQLFRDAHNLVSQRPLLSQTITWA